MNNKSLIINQKLFCTNILLAIATVLPERNVLYRYSYNAILQIHAITSQNK